MIIEYFVVTDINSSCDSIHDCFNNGSNKYRNKKN